MKAVKAMTILGVDNAAGKGGVHGQSRVRMNAAEKRKSRFLKLKRMGGRIRNVHRAATMPAVMHGTRVVGMPPAVLRRLRRLMLIGQPQRAKSASLTLQFATGLRRSDPTFAVLEAPLLYWARLAFAGKAEVKEIIQKNSSKQYVKLTRSKRP